jgi:hypothetical protein
MSSEYVLIWAHYKSANLGINGPYKSAKEVYYKSAKNLPVCQIIIKIIKILYEFVVIYSQCILKDIFTH